MTAGQFSVALPDGSSIERLPLGWAHGAWHLGFVWWPASDAAPLPSREEARRRREPLDAVVVEAVGADEVERSSGGHGGSTEAHRHVRIAAPGASALRVAYRYADRVVATEELPISRG